MSPTRTETVGALGLALFLATALRLWGLDYGIPHPTARPDEERVVGRAQTIFATGDWHRGAFSIPAFRSISTLSRSTRTTERERSWDATRLPGISC